MLGALIAGGASLISGLFGRNDAKKQARKEEKAIRDANDKATAMAQQMNKEVRARADAAALVPVATSRESASRTTSGVDMKGFMDAAEKNGFNPLTFLRSGALSLFAHTTTQNEDWTCTTGERAMDAALSGTYIPQLSPVIAQTKVPGMGEVLGNALTSGANQYLQDLSAQQNNKFQMDMMAAQLRGAGMSGASRAPRSGYVPQAFLSGSVTTGPGRTQEKPGTGPGGRPNLWMEYWDNINNVVVTLPNPDIADSEQLPLAVGGSALNTAPTVSVNIRPGSPADTAKTWVTNTFDAWWKWRNTPTGPKPWTADQSYRYYD